MDYSTQPTSLLKQRQLVYVYSLAPVRYVSTFSNLLSPSINNAFIPKQFNQTAKPCSSKPKVGRVFSLFCEDDSVKYFVCSVLGMLTMKCA